jgi:hypothetical protein
MRGEHRRFIFLSLIAGASCISQEIQVRAADSPEPLQIRSEKGSDFSFLEDAGYVVETREAQPAGGSGTIIHVRESHTDLQGQRSLIAMLERLIERHSLRLILVEGGQGDLSLSYLRSFGPPGNRKAIAEKYLGAGLISAEEYVDLVSDAPLAIWGSRKTGCIART